MHQVSGDNALLAWQEAVKHLLSIKGKKMTNLLVAINDAGISDQSWLVDHDPASIADRADKGIDVPNWVFPENTWKRIVRRGASRAELYDRYPHIYERAKQLGPNAVRNRRAWGSYFQRLIDFGPDHVNQLENAVHSLSTWGAGHKGAITFHLASPSLDNLRPIGGPCWHFGELSCRSGSFVDFTVVYRSHDYFNLALGNFVGLCRLLQFICDQSGLSPGQLNCHSVYAWYDVSDERFRQLARFQQ